MLLSIIISTVLWAQTTISEVVGQAGGQVVTSREVEADVIFSAMYLKVDKPNYPLPITGKALQSATSNLLMEVLINLEAESFKLAVVSESEVSKAISTFQKNVASSSLSKRWRALEITKTEISKICQRKIRATRFIELKKSTFLTSPTQEELKEHFTKRKSTYGDKNFEDVKKSIRKELRQDKLDQALREWFQVLRSKYEIRNLLIES